MCWLLLFLTPTTREFSSIWKYLSRGNDVINYVDYVIKRHAYQQKMHPCFTNIRGISFFVLKLSVVCKKIYISCVILHGYWRSWKIVGVSWKRRNCSYQAVSPFPAVFSTGLENFLLFSSNLKLSSANSLILEESKICCLGKVWWGFELTRHNSADSVPISNLVCINEHSAYLGWPEP